MMFVPLAPGSDWRQAEEWAARGERQEARGERREARGERREARNERLEAGCAGARRED